MRFDVTACLASWSSSCTIMVWCEENSKRPTANVTQVRVIMSSVNTFVVMVKWLNDKAKRGKSSLCPDTTPPVLPQVAMGTCHADLVSVYGWRCNRIRGLLRIAVLFRLKSNPLLPLSSCLFILYSFVLLRIKHSRIDTRRQYEDIAREPCRHCRHFCSSHIVHPQLCQSACLCQFPIPNS